MGQGAGAVLSTRKSQIKITQFNGVSLRRDQIIVLEELEEKVKKYNQVVFHAPTNFGKTRVYYKIIFDLNLFPCVVCLPTYDSVEDNLRELKENFDVSEKIVALPMGKDKVRKKCKKKLGFDCKSCERIRSRRVFKKFDFEVLRGKIIDAEWALEETQFCPYCFLNYVAEKHADIVVTSQRYVECHPKLAENKEMIIVDECDKAFEPVLFKLYDFDIYQAHLQLMQDHNIVKLRDILKKLLENPPRFSNKIDLDDFRLVIEDLLRIVDVIADSLYIPADPKKIERDTFIDYLYEKKDPLSAINLALVTAYIKPETQVNELNEIFGKLKLFERLSELCSQIKPEVIYRSQLSSQEKEFLLEFLICGKRAERFVARRVDVSPERDGHGYLEIYLKARENVFQEVLKLYSKKLYVTATLPDTLSEDIIKVVADRDPFAEKKLVVLFECDDQEKKELVNRLAEKYSVLVITTSKKRAQKCCEVYGGVLVSRKSLEEIYSKKRRVYVDYYDSGTSRGVNILHVFDVAVVDEWIARDPARENRLDYTALYSHNAKRLYQHISRIFRTVNGEHRKRASIVCDREGFEWLKKTASWLRYVEASSIEEVLELLGEHVEPLVFDSEKRRIKFKLVKSGRDRLAYVAYLPKDCEGDLLEEFTVELVVVDGKLVPKKIVLE